MIYKVLYDFDIYIMYIPDINFSFLINEKIYKRYVNGKEIDNLELKQLIYEFCPDEYSTYAYLIDNKMSLVDIYNKNLSQRDIIANSSIFTLCIHGSRKCNLKCKYCFGTEDYLPVGEISIETAKKAIRYLVNDYGKNGKMYTIDFAGSGEPLLRFEFIKEIEEYCEQLRNEVGKKIIISFPTNATLLKEEHIRYLNNHPDILYGFSLDGDEDRNSNRVYSNGKAAFDDAIKGIKLSTSQHSGFAITVTKKNENIDEVYDYLYSLDKGDAISSHLVRDFSNSETSLYKIDINNLILSYRRLTEKIIDHLKVEDFNYMKSLLNGDDIYGKYILKVLQKGINYDYRCDAGRNRVAVDDKGDLFACSVMNGNKDFYIGNIYDGIDQDKQNKFLNSNVKESKKCQACWCHSLCRGECMAISYMNSGKLFNPNYYMCEIKQRLISLAVSFEQYLKEKMPESYRKLQIYFNGTRNYFQTDSAVWSAVKYLNYTGSEVTYREVALLVESIPNGASVSDLESIIKMYKSDACAVSIKRLSDFPENCMPLIGCMRLPNGRVEYYLVEKGDKDQYVINSLENRLSGMALSDKMISRGFNVFIGAFEKIVSADL